MCEENEKDNDWQRNAEQPKKNTATHEDLPFQICYVIDAHHISECTARNVRTSTRFRSNNREDRWQTIEWQFDTLRGSARSIKAFVS
jgi:hypothetical protein